eukprot:768728-Hanusia_phi.AAC.5
MIGQGTSYLCQVIWWGRVHSAEMITGRSCWRVIGLGWGGGVELFRQRVDGVLGKIEREERRGEERRGEERRGEERRGEERRGEARRGEARRGEEIYKQSTVEQRSEERKWRELEGSNKWIFLGGGPIDR